jgi:hypothetical protein
VAGYNAAFGLSFHGRQRRATLRLIDRWFVPRLDRRARVAEIERCMMETREISYEQWQPFFNDFTHLHQGKRVNMETMGGDCGVRSQWCGVPLVGIVSVHPEAGDDDECIEVIARRSPAPLTTAADHATHSIAKPSKVHLAEDENGRAVALQIESLDRSITMIRFEPPHENLPQGFKIA